MTEDQEEPTPPEPDPAEPAATDVSPPASDVSPPETAAQAAERLALGRSPDVRADDPWAEAGRKILRFHLAKMLVRVPGVIAGEDAEEVHAMRVAARRMRAAWRVFGDGFERDHVRRYRGELRDIGARLGAVRDLDVLIEILVTYGDRGSHRGRVGIGPLLAAWRAERESRRIELLAALESDQEHARQRGLLEDHAAAPLRIRSIWGTSARSLTKRSPSNSALPKPLSIMRACSSARPRSRS